jgi:hypothetical protein
MPTEYEESRPRDQIAPKNDLFTKSPDIHSSSAHVRLTPKSTFRRHFQRLSLQGKVHINLLA